jgi:uncharacterized protein YndB with AHSA1/START domain
MVTTEPSYRMRGAASEWIDAPPEVVWTLVTDVTRMGEWSPETYAAEWLDGATGPAVGARFRGRNRRGLLQRWSTRPRVRVCRPPHEFTFALGIGNHDFVVWRYQLEPERGGTTVTESFTQRGYSLYGSLRPRRREQQLVDGMASTLRRLKHVAERTG